MIASHTVNTTCTDWRPAPAEAPRAFCAIGDIHGCANLLAALSAHLDTAAPSAERVYLGDLIDPHPKREHDHDCAAVLDQIADDLDRGAAALAGNHDAFMLIAMRAIADGTTLPWHSEPTLWRGQGGADTAAAWGIDRATHADDREVAREIASRMTDRQRDVLARLKMWHDVGAYVLVHAGFDPNTPLDRQQARASVFEFPDMRGEQQHPLWMRFKVNTDAAPKGRVLIHGHTPTRRPILGRKRICIDTGAKYGGPLTALEVDGDRMRLHQAWPIGMTEAVWVKDGLR